MLLCPNAVQFSPFVCVTDTTLHTSADQNAEVFHTSERHVIFS